MSHYNFDRLFTEILQARTRVYHAGQPTPLQTLKIADIDATIFVKREDLSPINAYKWRGAYNCTSVLTQSTGADCVVAASAGNHAQGVALAARMLGISAKIYMPLSTPMMKQRAVKLHGQDHVDIILIGDTYDQASDAAKAYAAEKNFPYVHPFDDLYTIAGSATIADEIILSNQGPFDYAFIQIGGGGMAAGVSSWIKVHHPLTKILGVEGDGQASMTRAMELKELTTLDHIDTFCDGTAVKRAGAQTFEICSKTLDGMVSVSNSEVCSAIQTFWDSKRVIPEPSGAMSLAGLIKYARDHADEIRGKKLLCILSGANMDFGKLALISSQSAVGSHRRKYFRFELDEKSGSLLGLLDHVFQDVNVSEFQYGKTSDSKGFPVIAFEASPGRLDELQQKLHRDQIRYSDVTDDPDIRYRIINYNPHLFHHPLLFQVLFPERKGALRDFMRQVSTLANLCYFNYAYSGETIGRALMGFEFSDPDLHQDFRALLKGSPVECSELSPDVAQRILLAA